MIQWWGPIIDEYYGATEGLGFTACNSTEWLAHKGTVGKVLLANGFNWQRYRVLFTNGVELGDLDQRTIVASGRTAKRLAKAASKA